MTYLVIILFVFTIYGLELKTADITTTSPEKLEVKEYKKDFKIDKNCYLNQFAEELFPWSKADCLNFEEVFKNYQYFESRLLEEEGVLLIKKYVSGKLENIKYYLITRENKLQLKK
jgi:hypothetical protein